MSGRRWFATSSLPPQFLVFCSHVLAPGAPLPKPTLAASSTASPRTRRIATGSPRGQPSSCEHPVGLAVPHHLLAIGIERIVDDPLGGIDRVVVLVAEMAEAFGDGLQSRPFRLSIERIVGVGSVDDSTE